MMSEIAVECMNLRRIFVSRALTMGKRETIALDGINFEVPRGIVFGLLGPNGSGKTTTIRILSTLLTPTSGQARIFGADVVREASGVRKRIGLILGGERGLYVRLTGAENLSYFAALNHLSRTDAKRRVSEVLELVGLSSARGQLVEQYSRGMRQRLHIARGLLMDPDLILMDEPTIGLDPKGAQELRQMVPEMVREGKTIFLTTHYMAEADLLCDRITIINKGTVIANGTPWEIKRNFSKVAILEVLLRQNLPDSVEALTSIKGVEYVYSSLDGPNQKITIHSLPGADIHKGRRLKNYRTREY